MQNIKNVTTLDGNNVELYIDLAANNLIVNNCKVTAIAMTAEVDGDEFYCGDLAVLWSAADDSNYMDNTSLLMRDTEDTTDNTATMGAFYWEGEFTDAASDCCLSKMDLVQQQQRTFAQANGACRM